MRTSAIVAGIFVAIVFFVTANPTASAASQKEQQASKKIVEVQPGDSLSLIADEHKTTYQRIYFANKEIEHPDIINPGDKLRIPHDKEKLNERPLPGSVEIAPVIAPVYSTVPQASPQSAPRVTVSTSGSVWDQLAACEAGGNWSINTGNGYYGGLQFSASSWAAVGGRGLPHQASKSEQIMRGQMLQARQGWGAWPACSAKLGLR